MVNKTKEEQELEKSMWDSMDKLIKENAKKREQEKMKYALCNEEVDDERVFDVKISVRDMGEGYEGVGVNLFNIERKNIGNYELLRLVNNIAKISDLVDLEKYEDEPDINGL